LFAPSQRDVLLTQGAEQDLESIYDYISGFDGVANANGHQGLPSDGVQAL